MIQYIIGAVGGVIIGGLLKENQLKEEYKKEKKEEESYKDKNRRFAVEFGYTDLGGSSEWAEYSFKSLKKAQEFLDKVLKLGFFPSEVEDYDGQEIYDKNDNQIFYKAIPHRIYLVDTYNREEPLIEYDEDKKADKDIMKKTIASGKKWEQQEPEDIKKGNLLYAGTEKDFKGLWEHLN